MPNLRFYPARAGFRALAALALLAAAACGDAGDAAIPDAGVIELSEQFNGDFSLIDQNGEPVTDETFNGKVMTVYFGFASCPDVCPLALGTLSAALNELSEKERAELAPVFITVDPERDTPAVIKDFLAFDDRIIGLTGSPEAAKAARDAYKVYATRETLEDSALGYTMNHTSLFYLTDRQGQPKIALHDTLSPQELAALLRRNIKRR